MKFTCSVDIDLPIDKVTEFFDNTENLKEWQDGFLRIEPISGIPGGTSYIAVIIDNPDAEIRGG